MISKIVVISAVLSCFGALSHASKYSNCGSEFGSIVSVDIKGCGDLPRCPLKKGTNATMDIKFISNVDSPSLTAVVFGKIVIEVEFILPNNNGCVDSGIVCPIKAGETYSYTTTLPIKTEYPRISVDIIWKLQNDAGKNIICANIPAKIVK